MPSITLHFSLAKRVLDRWSTGGSDAPFDLDCPVARNAFFHGAIGPDFGYMPGGHRRLSELAHAVRTGELTSNLIRSARTPIERAFAWGWLTHVLADRQIHALIGLGVGELVLGCRRTFIGGSTDFMSHLRVEIGVDIRYAARHPDARSIRLRPAFDDVSINFLAHAYEATYGFAPSASSLLVSHRCMGRRAGQALASIGILAAIMDGGDGPGATGLRWTLQAAYRANMLSAVSLAYMSPVSPSDWLMQAIDEAAPVHTERFMEIYRDGGTDVGDYDLDTGEPLAPAPWPPVASQLLYAEHGGAAA